MNDDKKNTGWVYVFVGNTENKEEYLGLYDKETKMNFIPAFGNKDDAQDCFLSIPREKGKKYEVQAVHLEELNEQAAKNDFVVAMVDKDGNIIKRR